MKTKSTASCDDEKAVRDYALKVWSGKIAFDAGFNRDRVMREFQEFCSRRLAEMSRRSMLSCSNLSVTLTYWGVNITAVSKTKSRYKDFEMWMLPMDAHGRTDLTLNGKAHRMELFLLGKRRFFERRWKKVVAWLVAEEVKDVRGEGHQVPPGVLAIVESEAMNETVRGAPGAKSARL